MRILPPEKERKIGSKEPENRQNLSFATASKERNYLIVGLGNPGKEYQGTRHNVGFRVVSALTEKRGLRLRRASRLVGELAEATIEEKHVFFLLPVTFMNSSGDAVKRCIEMYQIPIENALVVCDDVALPLGKKRIRAQGSAGGHNGLKSIEAHLGTRFYARFRIGVGAPAAEDLADYVLGTFSEEEKPLVVETIAQATDICELWIREGLGPAMQEANKRPLA